MASTYTHPSNRTRKPATLRQSSGAVQSESVVERDVRINAGHDDQYAIVAFEHVFDRRPAIAHRLALLDDVASGVEQVHLGRGIARRHVHIDGESGSRLTLKPIRVVVVPVASEARLVVHDQGSEGSLPTLQFTLVASAVVDA